MAPEGNPADQAAEAFENQRAEEDFEKWLAEGHIPEADNQSKPIRDDEIPF